MRFKPALGLAASVMAHYKNKTMARFSLIFILAILTFASVFGQIQQVNCDCPKTIWAGTKPDSIFYLANGKTIVLCGYKNPDIEPTTFSEFILAVCGQDSIIDFWGAVLTCRLKVNKDTLLVEQLQNLPIGKDFKYQETVWTTEKIYFSGQKIVRKLVVNRQINKYNHDQIKSVIKSYEAASPGIDESKMEIACLLFIATISGDKTSRQYFNEFRRKFILDGDFAEGYNDLTKMLNQWDKKE
jgi:hypothetical protein